MKSYQKPEIKVLALTTNERLMSTVCETKVVVDKFKFTSFATGDNTMVCTYTWKDS